MAKGGKHLVPEKKRGAHLAPKDTERKNEKLKPQAEAEENTVAKKPKAGIRKLNGKKKKAKMKQKKLSINESLIKLAKFFAMLLFCFLMITPLRSCVFKNAGYVGERQAEKIAIADSGVKSGELDSIQSDMIKLDGETCYKIEFTSDVHGYRYLVNAETGEIVAQGFFRPESPNKEN